MPGGITLTGSAFVDLDLGTSLLNGGTAINFQTSFPVASGHPTQGFSIDTGDSTTPIVLDYSGFLVDVSVTGTLGLASVFSLAGVFTLQADSSSLKVLGAGTMLIGPDIGGSNALVDIHALGVLILNHQGLAADLDIGLSLGIPDLGLTVNSRLLVNTTGATQTIEIPSRLLSVIQSDVHNSTPANEQLASFLLGRLTTCADSTVACYAINGGAPHIFNGSSLDLSGVNYLLTGVGTAQAIGGGR